MDTKILGGKIAQARKEKNMSQAQLAQLLFISPQAVGKWERGESVPDIITFHRLAEVLGVDLNYFSEKFTSEGGVPIMPEAPESAGDTRTREELITNFSGSSLAGMDFAGVTAHKRKFKGSSLRGADFSGADLTGSAFGGSDVREANFDGANLTDCTMSAIDLSGASFAGTILVRTELSKSDLSGAKFTGVTLVDSKLTMVDLRKTTFESCVFDGVDFSYSDLRGAHLEGQIFTGVKFHNTALTDAMFIGATLTNVSFRSPYAITNRYYRSIQTIRFDDAKMDKLTYAALKGIGADLTKVTLL